MYDPKSVVVQRKDGNWDEKGEWTSNNGDRTAVRDIVMRKLCVTLSTVNLQNRGLLLSETLGFLDGKK